MKRKKGKTQYDDERAARLYRLCQAAAHLKLFRLAHGREARNADELEAFVQEMARERKAPIDPFGVLTREEVDAVMRNA